MRARAVALVVAALASSACRRAAVAALDPPASPRVDVADPAAAPQLLSGFADVSDGRSRSTRERFSVRLGRGVWVLSLELTLPVPAFAAHGPLTLSATVNGARLPPETYAGPGDYTYVRTVDEALVRDGSAQVDFEVDKAFVPGGADARTLGIIVRSVRLELR
jgi:hypothetical protein